MEKINKIRYIVLYPELIAAAFKVDEIDNFLIWCVMKDLDKQENNAQGLWTVEDIKKVIKYFNSKLKNEQIHARFLRGEGKFWFWNNRKINKCTVPSCKKVVDFLKPTMLPIQPFNVRIDEIPDSLQECRAFLFAMVAGRFIDERPLSNKALEVETLLNKRTIIRYKNLIPDLNICANWEVIFSSSDPLLINEKYKHFYHDGKFRVHFEKISNTYYILKQLPNSHTIYILERFHIKKRPKELRYYDRTNNTNLCPRKYIHTGDTSAFENIDSSVIKTGKINSSRRGNITIWHSKATQDNITYNEEELL